MYKLDKKLETAVLFATCYMDEEENSKKEEMNRISNELSVMKEQLPGMKQQMEEAQSLMNNLSESELSVMRLSAESPTPKYKSINCLGT